MLLELTGSAKELDLLRRESGGHRWQRVPPTERKGRMQTSTVTVAVMEPKPEASWVLNDRDIEMRFTKDSGPGGQHRNKTESAVVLTHLPTRISARGTGKCQHNNRRIAREMLEARVAEYYGEREREALVARRREQVGSGQRGDKIRTYALQNDLVHDHRSGVKVGVKRILDGQLQLLA
jgi:peptide chain release factor 1